MGSVAISQVVPDLIYRPYTMLSEGLNKRIATSSDPAFRAPASHTATSASTTAAAATPNSLHQLPSAPGSANNHSDHHSNPPPYSSQHVSSGAANQASTHLHESMTSEASSAQHRSSEPHQSSLAVSDHDSDKQQQHRPQVSDDASGCSQMEYPPSAAPLMGVAQSSPSSPRLQPTYRSTKSLGASEATSPSRIKVRDLSHIQSIANDDILASSRQGTPGATLPEAGRQYEISSMPVTDIIEMVAGLLTKITTTNDQQHEHIHRHIPPPEGAGSLTPQTTSVLAFHGKNVPIITILNYLSRIHKYCPTTYEVFLSLLVYFDRMTEAVNRRLLEQLQRRSESKPDLEASFSSSRSTSSSSSPSLSSPNSGSTSTPVTQHHPSHPSITSPTSTQDFGQKQHQKQGHQSPSPSSSIATDPPRSEFEDEDALNFSHYFVVDSYNIHRLVIAGVTCASKFFSDVFYTNSRYAKVGFLFSPFFFFWPYS